MFAKHRRLAHPSTLLLLSAVCASAIACSAAPIEEEDEQPKGVPALGGGTHSTDAVEWTVIATADDGLDGPRDLEFNPSREGELWVVSRNDDSVLRILNAGQDDQESEHRVDEYALHFMEEVSAISFSQTEKYKDGHIFGTCQESNNTYNDQAMGNGFMGPALWSSDWEVFGFSNPEAVKAVGSNLGSHLDMMHESPFCMGIGWETGLIYWTVDGEDETISRYDFGEHHDVGYDDHSDGEVLRYKDVSYTRVPDVPSHIVFDQTEKVVYYNDTGSGRLMRFDPSTASRGRDRSNRSMDHGEYHQMDGGDLTIVLGDPGAEIEQPSGWNEELGHPSGLTVQGDVIYLTDNQNSRIIAVNKDGTVLDWLDTGLEPGSLMGVRVDAEGSIWVVDNLANEVIRLRGKK